MRGNVAAKASARPEEAPNDADGYNAEVDCDDNDWWVQIISSETVQIAAGPDDSVVYRDDPWGEPRPDP